MGYPDLLGHPGAGVAGRRGKTGADPHGQDRGGAVTAYVIAENEEHARERWDDALFICDPGFARELAEERGHKVYEVALVTTFREKK